MNRFNRLLTTTSLGMIFVAQGALADVTPSDVWQDWRDYMQGVGYGLTATEDLSGDRLTVSDLRFDLSSDPDQGAVTVSFDTLGFVQNNDGTVSVVMPDAMPIIVDVVPNDDDSEAVRMALTVNQNGHDMIISGTPAAMTSTYSAGLLGLTLDAMTIDGETLDAANAMMKIMMTDVKNTTRTTIGAMRDYSQNGTVAAVTYDMQFKDPNEPAVATIAGTSSNLMLRADGALPLGLAQATDMATMLQAGMDVSGTLSGGNSTMTVTIEDPNSGNTSAAVTTEASTLTAETSTDGLSYAGTRQGTTVSMQPAEFPFLLSFAMENAAFNLSGPAMKSDTPQDFALGLNIGDFTMSDMIWGMINPQGNLPRDPASIALDLSGKLTLLADFLDAKAAERITETGDMPAQVESVSLNSLIVDALGAKLTGNGSAVFDNTDADNSGMANPAGAVDLKLVGGNVLLESLVESGLLPAQTAMGARMMMGMFAVPGPEDDTLTSKLEFTRSGSILANGQRIK